MNRGIERHRESGTAGTGESLFSDRWGHLRRRSGQSGPAMRLLAPKPVPPGFISDARRLVALWKDIVSREGKYLLRTGRDLTSWYSSPAHYL
jgi:hypothetical protein